MDLPSNIPRHFAARLVEVGRERIERCDRDVESDDPFAWTRLAGQLHAFAGEASLMGLVELGDLARVTELQARAEAARAAITDEARASLREKMRAIRASIDALAAITERA